MKSKLAVLGLLFLMLVMPAGCTFEEECTTCNMGFDFSVPPESQQELSFLLNAGDSIDGELWTVDDKEIKFHINGPGWQTIYNAGSVYGHHEFSIYCEEFGTYWFFFENPTSSPVDVQGNLYIR